MKIFEPLYDYCMVAAKHRLAPYYLGFISAIESIFFPIPTDVMLAPMVLADREKAWRYAFIASLFSAIGGVFGYLIGYFAFETVVQPFTSLETYNEMKQWFDTWGIAVVFIAGFSPVPYKVFTLTAGALSMAFLPFVLISLISRGMRFYLVAGLIKLGGETMEYKIKQHVEYLGWLVVIAVVVLYLIFR